MNENKKNKVENKILLTILIEKAEKIQKDIESIQKDLKYFKEYFKKNNEN